VPAVVAAADLVDAAVDPADVEAAVAAAAVADALRSR